MNVSVKINQTDDTAASSYSKVFSSIASTLDLDSYSSSDLQNYIYYFALPSTKPPTLSDSEYTVLRHMYKIASQEVYEIAAGQNLVLLLIDFFTPLKYEFQNESFRLESYSDPEEDSSDPRLAITILTKSDDIEGDIDKHHRLSEKLTELQRAESLDSNDMFLFLEYLE
jgi:hypothetical protein